MLRHLVFSTSITTALLAASASAYAAKSPQDFIKDAIQGDNSEIMLGQLAQQKGGDQKTKDFAQTLVTDHTTAKQQAENVAKSLGVTVPDQPTSEAKDEQSKLEKLSGADFDREFANYMVSDHQKDIQEFQDEAGSNNGQASDLAKQQLPVLQKHLSMAQSLASEAAQTNASTSAAPVPAPAQQNGTEATLSSAPTKPTADEWRASKLTGVSIYGPDNKKVGGITDVLMSKDGKAEFVVVGVGGFLGIGQKDVAIPFQQVQFSDQPVSQSGSGGASGAQSSSGSASDAGNNQDKTSPDHGTIDMTADQLKSAPSFKFGQ